MNSRPRRPKADSVLMAAEDTAHAALVAAVGVDSVGEHLAAVAEADRVLTHLFGTTHPGYRGWCWAVTVARAPRQKAVTVNEVVLVPGEDALVAPEWLPWTERLAKDDLGPGDLVPAPENDPRLVPGYLVGDEALDESAARGQRAVVSDVGLGRERVLSIEGRAAAADRWYAGEGGPDAPIALAAPAHCGTCGFLIRVDGPLSASFGVCANASSPNDGHVVSLDHGCGAHSDVRVEQSLHQPTAPAPVHDTITWDVFGDDELEIVSR